MPTGYTAEIVDQEKEFDIKKWLTTTIPRAFGFCYGLRDESFYLSEEEIRKRLQSQNDNNYYADALAKQLANQEIYQRMNDQEWQLQYDKYYEQKLNDFNTSIKQHIIVLQRLSSSLITIMKLIHDCNKDITFDVLKFGKEQLESELKCYDTTPVLNIKPFDIFKSDTLKDVEDNIDYYTKKLGEYNQKGNESLDIYNEYVSFIERNLLLSDPLYNEFNKGYSK